MNILGTMPASASLTRSGVSIHPWIDNSSLVLGGGFDTLKFEPCASAVKRESPDSPSPGKGQKTSYELTLIEDAYKFRESLTVTASASFKSFGGKASARMQMYSSLNIDSYNVFLIARVSVVNVTEILGDVALKDVAKKEWLNEPNGNMRKNFCQVYGDTYVSAVTRGGELFVVFEFAATTKEEQNRLRIILSGSAGGFSASLDLEKSITEISKHTTTKIQIHRDGGQGDLPEPELAKILELVRTFPAQVSENPVPIFFETQLYSRIPDPTHINLEAVDAERRIEDLAKARDEILQRKRDLKIVQNHLDLFDELDAASVSSEISRVDASLLTIERCAEDAARDRYSALPNADYPTINDFSNLPIAIEGKLVPAEIRLVAASGGTVASEDGETGEWVGVDKILVNFSLECPAINDEEAKFEYLVHYADWGDKGWFTEPEQTPQHWHEAIAIKLTGPEAVRYSVAYQVKRYGTNATYYGRDGTLAGLRGASMRIVGVRVVVKLKADVS